MPTRTQTLADFLLARIDEDEEWARVNGAGGARMAGRVWERLLAECEAKRRIVERFTGTLALHLEHGPADGKSGPDRVSAEWREHSLRELLQVLEDLAQPYADHPEFREEWRVV